MKTININLQAMVAKTNNQLILVELYFDSMVALKLAHPVVPFKNWLLTFTPVKEQADCWQVKMGNLTDIEELTYRLKTMLTPDDFNKFNDVEIIDNPFWNTTKQIVTCSKDFLKKMQEKIDKDEKPWRVYQSYIADSNKVGIKESARNFDMRCALSVPQHEIAILTVDDNNSQKSILMSTGAFPCFIFAAYNRKEKKGLLTHIDYDSHLEVVLALLSRLGDRNDIDLHIVGGEFISINQGVLLIELTKSYGTYQTVCLLSDNHRNFALDVSTGEINCSTLDILQAAKDAQRLEATRYTWNEIFQMPLQDRISHLDKQLQNSCCIIYLGNYGETQYQSFERVVRQKSSDIAHTIDSHRTVAFSDPLIYSGTNTANEDEKERDKISLQAMRQFPRITAVNNLIVPRISTNEKQTHETEEQQLTSSDRGPSQ